MNNKLKVFKVRLKNVRPSNGWPESRLPLWEWASTAHWIVASSEEDAIEIAKKYKIGNPMGGETFGHKTCKYAKFSHNVNYRGKLWIIESGELVGHETPLDKKTIKQLSLAE
jgi:hypothetical protein